MNDKAVPMIVEKHTELETLLSQRSEIQSEYDKKLKAIDIEIGLRRSALGMLIRMLTK